MAWVPLESNPEVMTKFIHKLGVPAKWGVVDVYGLEPDLLAMVPRPVLAVILLYPDNQKFQANKEKEEAKESQKETPNETQKETVKEATESLGSVYYLKQYIQNACGTIALIHSVANNLEAINLEDGFLKTFLEDSKDLSFSERGTLLINVDGITVVHKELAQEGQTEAPEEDTPVYHHFIAFVHREGTLYELDGRKDGPIVHGATSAETLLEDAARVCKEYMARDPDEMCFTVVALTASE